MSKLSEVAKLLGGEVYKPYETGAQGVKIGDQVFWIESKEISFYFYPSPRESVRIAVIGCDTAKKSAEKIVADIQRRLLSDLTEYEKAKQNYNAQKAYELKIKHNEERLIAMFPGNVARANNTGKTYTRALPIAMFSGEQVTGDSITTGHTSQPVNRFAFAMLYDCNQSDELAEAIGAAMVELFKLKPMKEHKDRYLLGEPFRDRTKIGIGRTVARVLRESIEGFEK